MNSLHVPRLYSILFAFLLLVSLGARGSFKNHVKAPAELQQGCPDELLQSHSFRHFASLCKSQPPLAIVAYEGVRDAMEDCRERMKFHSWDCSQPGTVLHEPSLLRYGYRETAYLLAMSAAGAAWGVATACAQGWLEECKCPLDVPDDWSWQGCSYGVNYAISTSRKLFTRTGPLASSSAAPRETQPQGGQIGRKEDLDLASANATACQQKTCWKKTADLTAITDHLTDRYYKAKQVVNERTKVRNADLIYLEPSPETCTPYTYELKQRRSLPRVCNWRNETHTMGDCNSLCCGRGFTVRHEPVTYKCDCKVLWCCKVQCNECLQHQWISTCLQ
ncbi:Protein Wnt-4 [Aphelenchoides fujianensis]|nr:Protein Wnt-4 [Aphelenchoides fujianensis]